MGHHSRPQRVATPGEHPALSLLLSMGSAVLVTAVMFGSAGIAGRAGGSPAEQTTAAGASQLESEAPRSASPSASAVVVNPQAPPTVRSGPTVELRWTRGASWVRVTDHKGVVRINASYPKGTVKRFTGPSFYLELGSAGAITLIGQAGKPLVAGGMGQTAECRVSQTVRCTITGAVTDPGYWLRRWPSATEHDMWLKGHPCCPTPRPRLRSGT